MHEGRLIVLEGLDGSGKATQADLLCAHMGQEGLPFRHISFPDYQNKSSILAKMYLAGEMGDLHQVNSYAASSFYSVDRYVSYQNIWKDDYLAGHTIVADRYTTSNAGHQMAKLPRGEWNAYLDWLTDFEYGKLGLPRPSLVLYLDMHPQVSRRLLSARYKGDESRRDIHEADYQYSMLCREAALYAAAVQGWEVILCSDEQQPFPEQRIAALIWEKVLGLCHR